VRCHGGGDNQTGAPPVSITGKRDTTFPGVGAHSAHVTAGGLAGAYDCRTCHPDPRFGSKQHGDGVVELTFGALATASGKLAPALDPASYRCSNVYCHGATLTGGANVTPEWTKVGQGEAGCGTCHGIPPPAPHPAVLDGAIGCQLCHAKTVDATGAIIPPAAGGKHINGNVDFGHPPAFMDATSSSFHALHADRGLDTCQLCHGQSLDGGVAGVACAKCHGDSWRTTCTMCHGGTDNATGAPPKALWGYAGDPNRGGGTADPLRVGAHTVHVTGSGVAPPFECGVCHVKPADALSPGHVDPIASNATPLATVQFLGLAAQGTTPTWSRANGACSATYCHGATLSGGTNTAPTWTGGASQAACGTCHGLPPKSPHPTIGGSGTAICNPCHAQTVDASGQLIAPSAGGKHLDGIVEATSYHEASWMDPTSSNFHAFTADRDVASCTACHGASLGGGIGPACASCHSVGGTGPDFATCTACHGGVDNATGAPPKAIWGSDADPSRGGGSPAERATRVGAHTAHVTGSTLAPAFDCAACHVTPSAILSPGHLDNPTATLTWGALATADAATPGWNRAANTCSGVYCHGATLSGGTNTAPNWTAGASQAACGTCHGIPPLAPHPAVPAGVTGCVECHADSIDASGALIAPSAGGKHLNGRVDGNHPASWMDQSSPDFHAFHANAGLAVCQACHGQLLDGSGPVSTVACATCHGAGWATTCTMCHGGVDNTTGAPPKATWGNGGDAIRIGAHTAHVTAGPISPAFDCAVCHVKPSDAFAAGHIDLPTATVTFGGVAIQGVGQGVATWNRSSATCASTYCHGGFQGGNASNTPVWTGGSAQGNCGTCHGLPPAAPHPAITGGTTACNPCHPGTIDQNGVIIPPAKGGLHLDGQVEFTGGHDASWMDQTSAGFHAYSANRGLSACQFCHGTNLDGVGGSTTVGCQQCHGTTWRTSCVMCHGGVDNQSGAPPKATWGQGADLVRIGAHTAHVTGGTLAPAFDCTVCHVKPTDALSAGHIDAVTATVTFGGLASQGTSPVWARSPATCASVYCHGATLAGGSITTPVWTAGASQAVCGTCHGIPPPSPHPSVTGGTTGCNPCHGATVDTAGNVIPPASGGKHLDGVVEATGHGPDWMNTSRPGFHAFSADRGLANCQSCHGAALDGGLAGVACASCHGASWQTTCTMCHGGAADATGAPPEAIWGYAGDPNRGGGTADAIRVGAHTSHVTGSNLAPPFDCSLCHVKPASALTSGHIDPVASGADPLATVTFSGLAAQGTSAAWTRSAATCTTYCHGATLPGGSNTTPVWTSVGTGQAACGTCHGIPPPSPHPTVTGGLPACNACHGATIDAAGNVIPPSAGGKHLDGVVEATGHGADWMNTASPGFHAFSADADISQCQSCHGATLDGGTVNVACASCHKAGGTANDFATCVACHGGVDNPTGAPPMATWGHAGDPNRGGGTADPIRVGAHTVHVTGSAISPAFGCEVCHVKPASIVATGHIDQPTATLTFGGLATTQGAVPVWTRSSATCASTYCHGAFNNGSTGNAPVWTGGSSQAVCGTCHGTPPGGSHPTVTGGLPACNICHPQTVDANGNIIPPASGGKHLDGVLEVTGHGTDWMNQSSPGFHAYSANQGLATCESCHGATLDGGSVGVSCAQCHGAGWKTNCIMCHGGVDNSTGAPPGATWGHGDPNRGGGTLDPIRIGAHTTHVSTSKIAPAFSCPVCHVTPADALAAGHIDQPTATVTFAGLAVAGGAQATWTRTGSTCSTYCHGATLVGGTNRQPDWTKVGQGQAACGTCHGLPPPAPHPSVGSALTGCNPCHNQTVDGSGAIIDPALGGKHLDGQVEATGGHDAAWMDPTSSTFHAFSANKGLDACRACHGQNLDGVGGATSVGCTSCHRTGGEGHDFATCTACHGGTDNQTGAPPAATWGHAGDPNRGGGTLDPIRVGAHTAHVGGRNLAAPFDCSVCHVKPADWLAAGHIDQPTATVTFGGVAIAQANQAVWTRSAATCASTYCHGGYSGTYTYNQYDGLGNPIPVTVSYAGKNATPVWTSGAMTCSSCHANPPRNGVWHSGSHGGGNECQLCHPDATGTSAGVGIAITNLALHVNGTVDVSPQWDTTCFGCH
jgi:predicted CxxxxCH...CXXCH cytochrome family protein